MRNPNSSPVSTRHFPLSGIATAHLSASGSFAIATSALTSCASFSNKSIAPGSSGFGNDTVGKSGSGFVCSLTFTEGSNPASFIHLSKVS